LVRRSERIEAGELSQQKELADADLQFTGQPTWSVDGADVVERERCKGGLVGPEEGVHGILNWRLTLATPLSAAWTVGAEKACERQPMIDVVVGNPRTDGENRLFKRGAEWVYGTSTEFGKPRAARICENSSPVKPNAARNASVWARVLRGVLQEFTVTVIRESCIQCHKGWTEEHLPIERAVPVRAEGRPQGQEGE